jgi:tetratricopeptide (TPR) repeat protein
MDPDQIVPIESVVAVMMGLAVAMWQQAEAAPRPDAARTARVPALLEATTMLTGQPTEEFARALTEGDLRAYGALAQLEEAAESAAGALRERCLRARDERQWASLQREAQVFGYLAKALQHGPWLLDSYMLVALASRALGDVTGAIAAYRAAISVATQLNRDSTLAVAYDNLGNILADIGALDDALTCYQQALDHERNSAGRHDIRMNHARALTHLGELRSAYRILNDDIVDREQSGDTGLQFALFLDNLAETVLGLGEPTAALRLLRRAAPELPADEPGHRAVNFLLQAHAHAALGDFTAEEAAFLSARDLAVAKARREKDVTHYRAGYAAARQRARPRGDEANLLLRRGIAAKQAEQWEVAADLLRRSADLARSHGDEALALRAGANTVALLADAGQFGPALEIGRQVRHRAAEAGLARPEGMVIGTLVSLTNRGVDVGEQLGAVGLITTAEVLHAINTQIVAGTVADPAERGFETNDSGALDAQMAIVARLHHASRLAADRYRTAADKARRQGLRFELVNRLAGLIAALDRLGDQKAAADAADELRSLLDAQDMPLRGEIVGRRAIADRLAGRDPHAAIMQLRGATAAAERLRQRVPPGRDRVAVTAESCDIYYRLAELLRQSGEYAEAFNALQGIKGRQVLDARAAMRLAGGRSMRDERDVPATLADIQRALARLDESRPSVLVDLVAAADGITAYVVRADGIIVRHIPGRAESLQRIGATDVREREIRLVQACLHDPMLQDLVGQVSAVIPPRSRVLLVPDAYLHNVPLHLVPRDGSLWGEQVSIGYLTAAATLSFAAAVAPGTSRSFVAGDSGGDLPGAADECRMVAGLLGTEPVLGQQCTFDVARAALQGDLDVVHLAVHGRSDVRRGGRASLRFADGHGGVRWVALSELAALPWRARLVVFSGCGTGVSGSQPDSGLAGVAQAAAESGATSVLASLWPVDDLAAAQFMDAFYHALIGQADRSSTDLLEIMDVARGLLRAETTTARAGTAARGQPQRRDGRGIHLAPDDPADMSELNGVIGELLEWGPFVLVGNPASTPISPGQITSGPANVQV